VNSKSELIREQASLLLRKSFFQNILGFSPSVATIQAERVFEEIKKQPSLNKVNNFLYQIVSKSKKRPSLKKWTQLKAERDFRILKRWLTGKTVLEITLGQDYLGLKIKSRLKKSIISVDISDIRSLWSRYSMKFDTILINGDLHHIDNLRKFFKKLITLAKNRLIMFEPRIFLKNNKFSFSKKEWVNLNIFSEWVLAIIRFKNQIDRLDYKLIDYDELKKIFFDLHLRIVYEKYITFIPKEVIVHHRWLFVLDK